MDYPKKEGKIKAFNNHIKETATLVEGESEIESSYIYCNELTCEAAEFSSRHTLHRQFYS